MSDFRSTLPPLVPDTGTAFMETQTFIAAVWVPFTQNIGGGLGGFILAFLGLRKLLHLELAPAAEGALIVAGIIFGLAMLVRSFQDEVHGVIIMWAASHDRATLAQRDARITELEAKVLRLTEGDAPATTFQTQADAGILIARHFEQHLSTGRREVMQDKLMDSRRWERATNLLRDAKCINGGKRHWLAPNEGRAWGQVVMYLKRSGKWVRAQDGEWGKR